MNEEICMQMLTLFVKKHMQERAIYFLKVLRRFKKALSHILSLVLLPPFPC